MNSVCSIDFGLYLKGVPRLSACPFSNCFLTKAAEFWRKMNYECPFSLQRRAPHI